MITLYDMVAQEDRRPSPFCWRTKYALKHKGLAWREEPVGLTEKEKIAFAESKTVPVIRDGSHCVRDSWAIACHLDERYPDFPLFDGDLARSLGRFMVNWVDTAVHPALFRLIVADLYERIGRPDQPYFLESRGKRLGTTDFAALQSQARETGLTAFRALLEPARRLLGEQPYLAGAAPGYPDYTLMGAFLWARVASPFDLLEPGDAVFAWRERLLDLFDGLGRKAKAA